MEHSAIPGLELVRARVFAPNFAGTSVALTRVMNALASSFGPLHGVLDDSRETLEIGEQGQWFRMTDFRVDIAKRKPVARLLWALATGARDNPGVPVPTKALIEEAWPGEFIVRHAAQIRLRVAIATLRASGLSTRIVTGRGGYMLTGPVNVEGGPTPSGLIDVRDILKSNVTALESGVTALVPTEGTRATELELGLGLGLDASTEATANHQATHETETETETKTEST